MRRSIKPTSKDWWKEPFEKGLYPLDGIAADWTDRSAIEINSLKKILQLPKGAKVLDVACGVGRHSLLLSRVGYDITGTDISKKYLTIAKRNAQKQHLSLQLVRADMRKLKFREEFAAALNLFTSFGYFNHRSDDLVVLKGIFRSLIPGGIFVIDTMNLNWLKANFAAKSWLELSDGTLILEERKLPEANTSVVKSEWLFVRPNGKRSMMHASIRGYTPNELKTLLRTAGFTTIKAHAPLFGPAPRNLAASPRIVLSARKPLFS